MEGGSLQIIIDRLQAFERSLGNFERSIGELQGYNKIWLDERKEMLTARKEIFQRLDRLEAAVAKLLPLVEDIAAKIQMLEAVRNKVLGGAIVISLISGMIGSVISLIFKG